MDKKDIEKIKKEIEGCQKEREEYLSGWKRERADFLNFKKNETERLKTVCSAVKGEIILDILLILDDLYLAEEELPKDLKGNDWIKGLLCLKIKMQDFLKKHGVEEIKSLQEEFDPNFHEALEQIEKKGFDSGIVVEEIKKGYILEGVVIRPAKVKVSK